MQGTNKYSEFLNRLSDLAPAMFYTTVGVVAKLALYAKRGELSKSSLASCVILGYFSGYICAEICIWKGHIEMVPVLCPLAVVIGEAVMMWVLTNSDKLLNWGFKKITKK